MDDIVVEESFFEDGTIFQEDFSSGSFESMDSLKLRMAAEDLSHETEINHLISYGAVKERLQFDLPHQHDGALKILRDMNGSGLLADEVGLGKTITAGIVVKELIERGLAKSILILTPPSLVDQWVAELKEKFALDFRIVESQEDWTASNFLIASVDRVKGYNRKEMKFNHKAAHEIAWDLLIVDEAHKLKDRTTARWKFIDKIQKKRFLVLTATPFQNDLLELYNLLYILKKGHLGTLKEFKDKFLHRGNKRYPNNPKDLKAKLDEVMLRRRRDETIVRYTKRIPKIVPVDLTKEELDLYDRMTEFLKTKYFMAGGREITGRLVIYAILPKMTSSVVSAIESLTNIVSNQKYHEETREIASRMLSEYQHLKKDSKVEKLVEIVKEIMQRDATDKVLIYTRHPTTLQYITRELNKLGLEVVQFTGGLTREEKTKRIAQFREKGNVMISTDTGAEGLNFQFCNNLINYDLPWNPMAVEQRIGRLDRIGQKKDMYIYSLAIRGTMEERVVDLIINKMCCIGLVIGELPIILFNLGLDEKGKSGMHKIEEMLMNAFIDSKNNLDIFSRSVEEIAQLVEQGVSEYSDSKKACEVVLDGRGEDSGGILNGGK